MDLSLELILVAAVWVSLFAGCLYLLYIAGESRGDRRKK